MYMLIMNLPSNASVRLVYRRPNTTAAHVENLNLGNPFYSHAWWYLGGFFDVDVVGAWEVELQVAGQTMALAPFDVVATAGEIVNRAPAPIAVSLDPAAPSDEDVVHCKVNTDPVLDDPDYDTVRYHYLWSVDGKIVRDVTTAAQTDVIPRGLAPVGSQVACLVRPSDGEADGPAAGASAMVVPAAPAAPLPDASGSAANRFFACVVPEGLAVETALRVEFAAISAPPGAPLGRQFRYVNAFGFDGSNPGAGSLSCGDAAPTFPDYVCARLGCEPEYRNWSSEVGGLVLHVTGDAVAPGSSYAVSHIAASCGGAPAADACASASAAIAVSTAAWGDITDAGYGSPDGASNVLDISAAVDKVKGLSTALPEHRVWLKSQQPDPDVSAINVLDISSVVDAVKGLLYSFAIDPCP